MRDLCEVEFFGRCFWRGKVLGLAKWNALGPLTGCQIADHEMHAFLLRDVTRFTFVACVVELLKYYRVIWPKYASTDQHGLLRHRG